MATIPFTYSDVGLIADIVGAALLFLFGIAPQLSRDGTIFLSTGESDSEKRKAKTYDLFARIGAALIFVGFTLQLVGNHKQQSIKVDLFTITITSALIVIIGIAVYVIKKLEQHRFNFTGQYQPQFNSKDISWNADHVWQFDIENNTRRQLKDIKLKLPQKADKIDILVPRTEIVRHNNKRSLSFSELDPGDRVSFRIWNISAGKSTGEDCYMIVNKKIVRPKILKDINY